MMNLWVVLYEPEGKYLAMQKVVFIVSIWTAVCAANRVCFFMPVEPGFWLSRINFYFYLIQN
jgi:hypothetical protein